MVRVNDENARPEISPNDMDRERFGFKKRLSQIDTATSKDLSLSFISTTSDEPALAVVTSAQPTPREVITPISLLTVVDKTLGNPDACQDLFRTKLMAGKFDFRSRIHELTDQNRSLKQALSERRHQHKALINVLTPLEADINCQLRLAARDAATSRSQVQERSKLTHELKQVLRSVLSESTSQVYGRGPEVPAIDALRQCCSTEGKRADVAEARARALDAELAALRQELAEAVTARLEHQRAAQIAKQQVRQRVDQAAQLLQHQINAATCDRQQLLQVAQERESELVGELAKAKVCIDGLNRQLELAKATRSEPLYESCLDGSFEF